jgi:hypothetical protein
VPGKYIVTTTSLGPGWSLKSAMTGGHDAADVPVDVDVSGINDMVLTFTSQQTTLSGTVAVDEMTAPGQLPPAPTVVVFATDQTFWPRVGLTSRKATSPRRTCTPWTW